MDQVFQEIIMNVLLSIATALGIALGALVIRLFQLVSRKIEAEAPKVWEVLSELAVEAVYSAEQSKVAGKIDAEADKVLEFALEYVQRELDERGLGFVDADRIVDKIEATLWQEINQFKPTPQILPKKEE